MVAANVPALPSIYKNIAAPAGANPQDVQAAKDQLAMTYAPQEMGINSAIDFINQNLSRDISAQEKYGQIADQKIGNIGQELANTLQGNVGKIQDIYSQGTQQVGSAYDEALSTLNNLGSSVQNSLKSSAQSLGQGHALQADQFGRDPLSRLAGDLDVYKSKTVAGKATATSNLTTLGTQLSAIAQKAVGDSTRDYAQKRSDIATQVLKTIGQLQSTANMGIMEQLQKFSVLAETAGPTFRTLLSQATSARTEGERQAAKDELDFMVKMADIEEKRAKSDPNSLDNQMKRINIAKGMGELEEMGTEPRYISDTEGASRLQSFLDKSRRSSRSDPNGLSGTQVAGIQNFITQNMGSSKMSGIYNTSDPAAILASIAAQSVDPKTGLVHLPITKGSKYTNRDNMDYVVDMQTLLAALEARFGNVGPSAKIGTKI